METTQIDPLKDLLSILYSHVGTANMLGFLIPDSDKKPTSVFLSRSGEARLASCLAFIYGISVLNRKLAVKMFEDLRSQFVQMANVREDQLLDIDGHKRKYSMEITLLSDDGTFNGFAFSTYYLRRESENKPGIISQEEFNLRRWHVPMGYHYVRAYNGGLLYHGPAAGNNFAVRTEDVRFWSIHT